MTREEFDNEFDILYNNITSNQAPGLDTYEKSVFLTRGQDDIVKGYFDPKLNKVQEGFDGSQRRQIDFSMVTVVASISNAGNRFKEAVYDPRSNSKSVEGALNPLVIINERITVKRGDKNISLTVVPITFTEYDRLMSKPYKRPLKWQAWRILNTSEGKSVVDLVVGPTDEIVGYNVRFIRKPRPIILGPLDGLTIDGETYEEQYKEQGEKACELDPILHKEILQRAVELAKASYGSNAQAGDATLSNMVSLGQSSQTEIGFVQSSR